MSLPPQCYVEIPCPFCGKPSAFVDATHQPETFEKVIGFRIDEAPITVAFVCGYCSIYHPPETFAEKVAELIQAQKEQHRFWKRITAALAS